MDIQLLPTLPVMTQCQHNYCPPSLSQRIAGYATAFFALLGALAIFSLPYEPLCLLPGVALVSISLVFLVKLWNSSQCPFCMDEFDRANSFHQVTYIDRPSHSWIPRISTWRPSFVDPLWSRPSRPIYRPAQVHHTIAARPAVTTAARPAVTTEGIRAPIRYK